MLAKEIVSELTSKMEEGQELELFPQDWKILGSATLKFSDDILKEAIKSFPKYNVETPGRLFIFLCKKAVNTLKPKPQIDLSKITRKF